MICAVVLSSSKIILLVTYTWVLYVHKLRAAPVLVRSEALAAN